MKFNIPKSIKKLIIIGVILGVVNYFFKDIISLKTIQNSQGVLSDYITSYPLVSSFVFMSLFIITTSLSLPLIGLLSLTAGLLFPTWWALIMVYFSFFWHCFIMIKLIRGIFRDYIEKKFKLQFKKLYENIQEKGLYYVIFLRLSLVTPSFVVNCASAFTKLRTFTFSIVSLISSIPILTIFVISGKKLAYINSFMELYSHTNLIILLSLAFIAILPILVKKRTKK
tara:strand:- start:311 stop:988 length:678 start_codon:yes stop_codon:yes gene_type:complete